MHWMLCLSRLSILLSKHIITFLPITFLIFNWLSIHKKFWKAESEGFSTIQSMLYMSILLIQDKDLKCIQCYLCQRCRYKTHQHIPAHNFLNIQPIFNPQKVLESWDSGLFNHTINNIYVDTVNTRQGSLMHSKLSMSTLSIQFSHLITLYTVLCISHKTPVSTVSTNIAFNALHALMFISTVSTNNIAYTICNIIALILCIGCLDMPFDVHSNYNVDSNTKTSNYSKVWFKALIYFGLEQTSN